MLRKIRDWWKKPIEDQARRRRRLWQMAVSKALTRHNKQITDLQKRVRELEGKENGS